MKSLFLTTFILLSFAHANAGEADSLIRFRDLTFKSELEERAFADYSVNKSTDLVDLFLSPFLKETEVSPSSVHQKIDDCVNTLRTQTEGKPENKRVKYIYEYIHNFFFNVYKLNNSFCDIFSRGEYNCVSATALYAIVFSKLNIPYQIKEKPQHVYLEAYPNTLKILIETTSPEKGYYQFNDEFVSNFIKDIYRSKLITKEEMDTSSSLALFNKYFFASDNISLVQLAGVQYCNYGIYNLDDKRVEKAIDDLKKAYFLYPCEKTKYVLRLTLLYMIGTNNYNDMKQVDQLAILCRYHNENDTDLTKETLRIEFSRIIQTQLINNSNYSRLDSSFSIISSAIKDSATRSEIAFDYHYELARLGYLNFRDTAYELNHLEAAYAINPGNANLRSLILGYSARYLQSNSDPVKVMSFMTGYSNRFPFLTSDDQYVGVRANCLLEFSYRSYSMNNISKGDDYLKEFEQLFEGQKMMSVDPQFVERAYSSAASIYYKKGNYSKSKLYVKSGLVYAPSSFRLQQMLSQY